MDNAPTYREEYYCQNCNRYGNRQECIWLRSRTLKWKAKAIAEGRETDLPIVSLRASVLTQRNN